MSDSQIHDSESGADREFVHTRLIDASRKKVFKAFSDPTHLARWWGPNGFSSSFHQFDFRPGGQWLATFHAPDGSVYPNDNIFVEIIAPERVVFDHLSGHHFRMTLTLTEQLGKTLVAWRQVFDSAEEKQRIAEIVSRANEENLDRLTAEVANMIGD